MFLHALPFYIALRVTKATPSCPARIVFVRIVRMILALPYEGLFLTAIIEKSCSVYTYIPPHSTTSSELIHTARALPEALEIEKVTKSQKRFQGKEKKNDLF